MGAGSVSRGLGVDHLPPSVADVKEYGCTSTPLLDLPGSGVKFAFLYLLAPRIKRLRTAGRAVFIFKLQEHSFT